MGVRGLVSLHENRSKNTSFFGYRRNAKLANLPSRCFETAEGGSVPCDFETLRTVKLLFGRQNSFLKSLPERNPSDMSSSSD
jgi:hypothetical protein